MAQHKIRHALASWTNEDGTPGTAFRGQVAEIPESEATRLRKYGAIIGPDEEVEHPGILSDLPQSPSDEELINWISAANTSEVKALVNQRPELVPRIEGALTHVKSLRAGEDMHYNEIRLALQSGGLDTDEIFLGSGSQSGHDGRDTSAVGDEDIVVTPVAPPSGVTSLNPAGATTAPVDAVGLSHEDNTELKDANGLPAVQHNVLVEGPAQEVANYISTHPEEAAAILEAETVHSEGSPRVEVVNAVRAATGFTN